MPDNSSRTPIPTCKTIRQPEDILDRGILVAKTYETSRGEILNFDYPAIPPEMFLVTHADIPSSKTIQLGEAKFPLFAKDRVDWEGQPILAVSANNTKVQDDFLQALEIKVETGHTHRGKSREKIFARGDTGAAFSEATQIVEDRVTVPAYKPPDFQHTTVCISEKGRFQLHTNSHWPGIIHKNICLMLNLERDKVNIRPYPSRNSPRLWQPVSDACIATLLAWKSGKSISIQGKNSHASDNLRMEFFMRGSINNEKMLSALEVDFTLHCGNGFPYESDFLKQVTNGILGINPCDNYIIRAKTIYHLAPPSHLSAVAGSEMGFLAGEIFMSRIAWETKTDPVVWRGKWFKSTGSKSSESIKTALKDISNISDFSRKFASYEQSRLNRNKLSRSPGYYNGIGISCACRESGLLLDFADLKRPGAIVEVLQDENKVIVETALPNQQQKLVNYWKSRVSNKTGIEQERIIFTTDWSGRMDYSSPAVMGGNVCFVTQAIENALKDIPVHANNSHKHRKSHITPYSWGICIIEASVSSITLEIQSLKIWMIIDAGHILQSENALHSIQKACEDVLQWCGVNNSLIGHQTLNISFRQNQPSDWSSDVTSMPWTLIPAALMHATRQSLNFNVNHFPFSPANLFSTGNNL